MCGFVGFLGTRFDEATLRAANDTIHHRGPDASGVYFDEKAGVGLAHKRLSIIELSDLGAQPMVSACERYVIVFNGEIYNHLQLRQEIQALANHPWRGSSDTETLLQLIATLGMEKALQATVGMFSFAILDKKEKTISLARDRMGEKPLYYGWLDGCFVFGSELKALRALSQEGMELDCAAISLFFHHGYVPAPMSIWRNIRKLGPGRYLEFDWHFDLKWPEEKVYWDLEQKIFEGVENPFEGNTREAMSALENLLADAIRMQSHADVDLGAFLSGGIDSSLIVSLMQKHSITAVKTFSIGFNEDKYNEAHHARAVARHIGTDHNELFVQGDDVLKLLPQLIDISDEPFADPSVFPTYLVSKLASESVKVCLSGDAGDELFCGYNRYFNTWSYDLWKLMQSRQVLTRSAGAFLAGLARISNGKARAKLWRLESLAGCETISDYFRWTAGNSGPVLQHQSLSAQDIISDDEFYSSLKNNISQQMAFDTKFFLPDDILCKVDRTSMAVSLETRVPFLDHRIVEFAWKLPLSMKTDGVTGKTILRNILYQYVPEQLVNRPKQGFAMPLEYWLRDSLRDWAGDTIFGASLSSSSIVNLQVLQTRWQEHQSGKYDWSETIWKAAVLGSWLEGKGLSA